MSEWLRFLPHQIPFRSASSSILVDERTARGTRLASGGDALQASPPELMLIEAMAQIAGMVAFRSSGVAGSLAGIDQFSIERLPEEGDRVEIEAKLVAELGSLFRFEGRAWVDGNLLATGRFYLSEGETK
ncbi:MAG: hypothetical protein R3338_03045 [Thermoanaerobaculia bacterium]|nr:hypothetical protein [Thermoanaerobaculia bacterium]